VKEACGDEVCENVVIPGRDLAFEAELILAWRGVVAWILPVALQPEAM